MNRNRYSGNVSDLTIDVVASVDTLQFPPFGFQVAAKSLSADCLQTAISITLSFLETAMS